MTQVKSYRITSDVINCQFCGVQVYFLYGRPIEYQSRKIHKGRCKRPAVRYLTREEIEKEYGEVDIPEELEERFDLAMSKDN